MSKQIKRIKTALSDGSCESVDVELIHPYAGVESINYTCPLVMIDEIGVIEEKLIKSVQYNPRTYADLGVGDIVHAPDGEGCVLEGEVINVFNENPIVAGLKVRVSEKVNYYFRYELILLEKAENIDTK